MLSLTLWLASAAKGNEYSYMLMQLGLRVHAPLRPNPKVSALVWLKILCSLRQLEIDICALKFPFVIARRANPVLFAPFENWPLLFRPSKISAEAKDQMQSHNYCQEGSRGWQASLRSLSKAFHFRWQIRDELYGFRCDREMYWPRLYTTHLLQSLAAPIIICA